MNRQEFIDGLRTSLNGRIPLESVEDNVSYYQDYIAVEMRKGRTEEEVLSLLGDPRLIARTIVQTSGQEQEPDAGYEEGGRGSYYEEMKDRYRGIRRLFRLPGWLAAIIIILIVILAFTLIFSVLSFLMPFLLIFAAVFLMVKLFRDWLN